MVGELKCYYKTKFSPKSESNVFAIFWQVLILTEFANYELLKNDLYDRHNESEGFGFESHQHLKLFGWSKRLDMLR